MFNYISLHIKLMVGLYTVHFRALFELRFWCSHSIYSDSTLDLVGKGFVLTLGKARRTIERLQKVKKECKALALFIVSYGGKVGLYIFIEPF